MINALQFFIYRVSHIKEGKVVMLWWEYIFWFLLICSILRVHETGTVMPNSSVFFFYVACPLQFDIDIKIQKSRSIFSVKNSLNVPNVKLLSIFLIIFWDVLCFFAFDLISSENVYFWWFVTFYNLKRPLKVKIVQSWTWSVD